MLSPSARQLHRLISAPHVIVSLDGTIIHADAAFAQHINRENEELTGRSLADIAVLPREAVVDQIFLFSCSPEWIPARMRLSAGDGGEVDFPCRGLLLAQASGNDPALVCICLDERLQYQLLRRSLQAERMVWQQANFDTLTRLPNRQMFQYRLEQEVFSSGRNGATFAVLFIDLDEFKDINDTIGHAQGDQLLKEAAERLQACVRKTDLVARMGGDEFVVLLSQVKDLAVVDAIARKILESLVQPFNLSAQPSYISASIGVACFPADGETPAELLRHADQAMYAAKASGRNTCIRFERELEEKALNRVQIARDLRQALSEGQFTLVYQPVIELATGRVARAEALIRWTHGERGPISPAEFIPVAERNGLIGRIDEWVFNEATGQLRVWREFVRPDMVLSINCSPLAFSSLPRTDGPSPWRARLDELELPGNSIVLEITEGLLLEAGTRVSEALSKIAREGLHVAIDDFGTGYSSLAYLRRHDIDCLKIDKSFIDTIGANDSGTEIAETVIAMAKKLNIEVVAEGVETQIQHDTLLRLGCDYVQGYLYSRPVSAHEFTAILERGARLGPWSEA
ncbi:MAG: EAL domain-containing protein [Rhodocyclaceae bacterium]|nr:EAL domain-containing protein [Rhodocyclaceae bacterium]